VGRRSSAEGASRVEAPKAPKRGVVWRGGVFFPIGGGVWGGGSGPPQKIFLDLKVKVAYFRGLCAKFLFFCDHNSIEIQQ